MIQFRPQGTVEAHYPNRIGEAITTGDFSQSEPFVSRGLEQSEQLYTALKYLGRPTEMVIFHGESHDLERSGTPKLRYEFYSRILAWFDKYISRG